MHQTCTRASSCKFVQVSAHFGREFFLRWCSRFESVYRSVQAGTLWSFKPHTRAGCNTCNPGNVGHAWVLQAAYTRGLQPRDPFDDSSVAFLQAAYTRGLQPSFEQRVGALKAPSSRIHARVATNDDISGLVSTVPSNRIHARVATAIRAVKTAHARIIMCILTFSSVLPALKTESYGHCLELGTGSRPEICANMTGRSCRLTVRIILLFYYLFNILDRKVTSGVIVCI